MTNTCPRCDGQPFGVALVMRGGRCYEESTRCNVCEGRAQVSDEALARWVVGQALRGLRIQAGMPLSVLAQFQRIQPSILSGIEHGTHWLSQRHAKGLLECWGVPEDCAAVLVEAVGGIAWNDPLYDSPFMQGLRKGREK